MAAQRWTTQQVAALAPDPKVAAAARGLTSLRTWSELGCTDSLLWGKCQGSGKSPYQVTVDLTEPAFKCSCPSRKFPCKHGVALLLLWVEHGDAVALAEVSGFASEWAAQREQRASGRAARAAREPDEVVDPEAQARRRAQREAAMADGLEELDRWLGDLVRQGMAAARRQPYGYWDAMAARLVDAQLPGLAERVRSVGGAVAVRDDWADHLLGELGRWHLAIAAWARRDHLDPAVVGDLRALLGWGLRPEDRAGAERVRDDWVVAGVRQGEDGRIVSQRTWLWGRTTGRWALVLDFAAAGAALRVAQPAGCVVRDELVVHQGAAPARAELSGLHEVVGTGALPAGTTVAEAVVRLTSWLAANPWRDRAPIVLEDVVLVDDRHGWWLQDAAGDRLAVSRRTEPWPLLALSGGAPATVTAEWEDGTVHPMAVGLGADRVPVPL